MALFLANNIQHATLLSLLIFLPCESMWCDRLTKRMEGKCNMSYQQTWTEQRWSKPRSDPKLDGMFVVRIAETWNLLLCCFCSYITLRFFEFLLPVWLAILGCFFCLVPTHCRSHSISLWKSQDHAVDFTLHHLGWHASHRRRPRLASLCPLDGFVSLGSGPRAVGVSGRRANYCWWVAQLWNSLVQIFEVYSKILS